MTQANSGRLYFLVLTIFFLANVASAQTDTTNNRVAGRRDGYWIRHRINGNIKWEGHFDRGIKSGFWKFYNKENTFHQEGRLRNGKRIGNWYDVDTISGTKLDMQTWDGKGNRIGGATLAW